MIGQKCIFISTPEISLGELDGKRGQLLYTYDRPELEINHDVGVEQLWLIGDDGVRYLLVENLSRNSKRPDSQEGLEKEQKG